MNDWTVIGVYEDDESGAYSAHVSAPDAEAAKRVAQEECVRDNGGTPGEDDESFRLRDVLAIRGKHEIY